MISVKEIANRWELSPRRVAQLCASGKIEGAVKKGRYWMIPEDAQIPEIVKSRKSSTYMTRPRTTQLLPCPVGITS